MSNKYFRGPITKKDIVDYLKKNPNSEKTEAVRALQDLKEHISSNVFSVFSLGNPMDYKNAEIKYLDGLSSSQQIDSYFDDDYIKQYKYLIESIFKKKHNTIEKANFAAVSYEKFSKLPYYIEKYGTFKRDELDQLARDSKLSIEERFEINDFISTLKARQINFTGNKVFYFDEKQFNYYDLLGYQYFSFKCFYEKDITGNKHYFSINDLLNDIVTFGVEVGLPQLDLSSLPLEFKKFFPSINRRLKYALALNLIQDLRDKQERIIYTITDFEKFGSIPTSKGRITEQLVERYFRSISQKINGYSISVERGSPGDDTFGKIDLVLSIDNLKTKVNVKKYFQITMQTNENVLNLKKRRIKNSFTQLLQVEIISLKRIVYLWKKFNRPIGGIGELLSIQDKVFLGKVLDSIIKNIKS
ncbi:MAG: hypothetical protein V3575_00065 [Candidatus Absconditabacteria bacterium]